MTAARLASCAHAPTCNRLIISTPLATLNRVDETHATGSFTISQVHYGCVKP